MDTAHADANLSTSVIIKPDKTEDEKKLADISPQKQDISWGMEIRSYVFCPYTMVKDHRTGVESGRLQNIMDGDLDLFVKTWLLKNAKSQQNKTT